MNVKYNEAPKTLPHCLMKYIAHGELESHGEFSVQLSTSYGNIFTT